MVAISPRRISYITITLLLLCECVKRKSGCARARVVLFTLTRPARRSAGTLTGSSVARNGTDPVPLPGRSVRYVAARFPLVRMRISRQHVRTSSICPASGLRFRRFRLSLGRRGQARKNHVVEPTFEIP